MTAFMTPVSAAQVEVVLNAPNGKTGNMDKWPHVKTALRETNKFLIHSVIQLPTNAQPRLLSKDQMLQPHLAQLVRKDQAKSL